MKRDPDTVRALVQHYTGLSDDELATMVFERAYDYLERIRLGMSRELDDRWIAQITATKQWWSWWQKQWHQRDERFLAECFMNLPDGPVDPNHQKNARRIYLVKHEADNIPQAFTGSGAAQVVDAMNRKTPVR